MMHPRATSDGLASISTKQGINPVSPDCNRCITDDLNIVGFVPEAILVRYDNSSINIESSLVFFSEIIRRKRSRKSTGVEVNRLYFMAFSSPISRLKSLSTLHPTLTAKANVLGGYISSYLALIMRKHMATVRSEYSPIAPLIPELQLTIVRASGSDRKCHR